MRPERAGEAEEDIFPTASSVASGDVEEERRLMYVALTRAKRRLYVTWARSRFRFGRTENNQKSRFISEMRGDKQYIAVLALAEAEHFSDGNHLSQNLFLGGKGVRRNISLVEDFYHVEFIGSIGALVHEQIRKTFAVYVEVEHNNRLFGRGSKLVGQIRYRIVKHRCSACAALIRKKRNFKHITPLLCKYLYKNLSA